MSFNDEDWASSPALPILTFKRALPLDEATVIKRWPAPQARTRYQQVLRQDTGK